jgi:hypothetical protein
MEAHFVRFFSPGTFIAEQTEKPIDKWNVNTAMEMAHDIIERHGARPYGFCFITRARADNELDSKKVKESGMYYLGGKVETLEDIEKRNDPSERILVQNMKGNGWSKVLTNNNSWRWTQPLNDNDVVLDFKLKGK